MAASATGYTLSKVTEITSGAVSLGNFRVLVVDVLPTASSYNTAGYTISAANLGLRKIYGAAVIGQKPASGTPITALYLPFWDAANATLQYFDTGSGSGVALAEAGSATDVSGTIARLMVVGN